MIFLQYLTNFKEFNILILSMPNVFVSHLFEYQDPFVYNLRLLTFLKLYYICIILFIFNIYSCYYLYLIYLIYFKFKSL